MVVSIMESKSSMQMGQDSTTDLNGAGGRFGIKASSDLGNGLTASAHIRIWHHNGQERSRY